MLLSWDTANELVVSRKAESNGVGCAAATSRKAREVAHPQLFRSMLQDKPALYFLVKVAHPPRKKFSMYVGCPTDHPNWHVILRNTYRQCPLETARPAISLQLTLCMFQRPFDSIRPA